MAKFNYDTGVAYAKEQGKKESKKEVAKRMNVINATYELFKQDMQQFSTTRDNLYDNCAHFYNAWQLNFKRLCLGIDRYV